MSKKVIFDKNLHVYLVLRLVNTELEKENTELKQRLNEYSERYGEASSKLGETSKHTSVSCKLSCERLEFINGLFENVYLVKSQHPNVCDVNCLEEQQSF